MKGTLLVVDDDPIICENLQRLFTKHGFVVETAPTAEGAQDLLGRKAYDLVLTDLQMPGIDGLTFLRRIKERSPQTPVVMITAFASTEVVIQALRNGVNDFVPKPYQADELVRIVEREISRHRQAAPAGMALTVVRQLSKEQMEELDILIAQLRLEVGARCVLLVESNGYVISTKGYIEDLNISALAALVSGDLAATSGVASLLGEGDSFRLNYHEGERFNVYSSQVTPDIFLLIVFGRETRLGTVLHFAKQTLADLRAVIERSPLPPQVTTATELAPIEEFIPLVEAATQGGSSEPREGKRSYTFEEIRKSGLLDADALAMLDVHFGKLWASDT